MKTNTNTSQKLIEIEEWQIKIVQGLELTSADWSWLAKQEENEGTGRFCQIEELKAGLKITSTSWVGVLQFESFRLVIRPKLAGNNLRLVEMLEFTRGLQGLTRLSMSNKLEVGQKNLFDLFAFLLVEACTKVIKAGLISDYVQRENTLPVMRGRLLADQQALKHFGRVDRLECRYDEHETNTPENQLLYSALKVCARYTQDSGVHTAVRRQEAIFSEICDISEFDHRLVHQTLVYNRLNEHYRSAHAIAWFILNGLGIQDLFNNGQVGPFAFMLDMNFLFEQFIWKVVEKLCYQNELRVYYQQKNKSILWDYNNQKSYKQVIPDLLVELLAEQTSRLLPVDAKYKQYDREKISNSDLYQLFLYAFAYNPSSESQPEALLLFPSSNPSPQLPAIVEVRGQIGQSQARIHAVGVHIPSLIDELKNLKEPVYTNLLLRQLIGSTRLGAKSEVASVSF